MKDVGKEHLRASHCATRPQMTLQVLRGEGWVGKTSDINAFDDVSVSSMAREVNNKQYF